MRERNSAQVFASAIASCRTARSSAICLGINTRPPISPYTKSFDWGSCEVALVIVQLLVLGVESDGLVRGGIMARTDHFAFLLIASEITGFLSCWLSRSRMRAARALGREDDTAHYRSKSAAGLMLT